MIVALVILVGALAGTNLFFTFGVVRRLNEHSRRLATVESGQHGSGELEPAIGEPLPAFRATTLEGVVVSDEDLADGEYYVGFFTTGCAPCRDRYPEFAALADTVGRDRLLAIVASPEPGDAEALLDSGGPLPVVLEPSRGPLADAFGFAASPTLVRYVDGRVAQNTTFISELGVPVTA
jgi:thiol-disulfide isomerase/thioredoxin